jgi:hypothetical protein
MADALEGTELRVFRSLLYKRQCDTLVAIQTELTAKPEPPPNEIQDALGTLVAGGYLEEFEPGRWRLSRSGYGLRRSLLGDGAYPD